MSANRKEAKLGEAGLKASAALMKACIAMNAYMTACVDCGEPLKSADDCRILLVASMSEYGNYLSARHEKKGGAV